MKCVDLIRHLESPRMLSPSRQRETFRVCQPNNSSTSAVPRHREVNDFTSRKICIDLQVARPK
jgi:mRNA interferase HicA